MLSISWLGELYRIFGNAKLLKNIESATQFEKFFNFFDADF